MRSSTGWIRLPIEEQVGHSVRQSEQLFGVCGFHIIVIIT